jgi:hypothetical protein
VAPVRFSVPAVLLRTRMPAWLADTLPMLPLSPIVPPRIPVLAPARPMSMARPAAAGLMLPLYVTLATLAAFCVSWKAAVVLFVSAPPPNTNVPEELLRLMPCVPPAEVVLVKVTLLVVPFAISTAVLAEVTFDSRTVSVLALAT